MSIAIYPGSFDPVTTGHLSVLRQAVRLYAHVVVLVATHPDKKTLFTAQERLALLRESTASFPNVRVDCTQGMVVDYARNIGATLLVRGIRGATDAEFEMLLAQQNRVLAPDITTVLLPASAELSEVSSSRLKELAQSGADPSRYCPAHVALKLRDKLTRSV